jgi:hypothetical protein
MMNLAQKLRHISQQEFALLGMTDVAYVKRIIVDDAAVYGVFAADGTQMVVVSDRELAFATIRQHDIEPVSVH